MSWSNVANGEIVDSQFGHDSLARKYPSPPNSAEGGMGALYRATYTKMNRDVAIKVLPEAFAPDAMRTR